MRNDVIARHMKTPKCKQEALRLNHQRLGGAEARLRLNHQRVGAAEAGPHAQAAEASPPTQAGPNAQAAEASPPT